MPENDILFSVSLPDGTKTTLNAEQYNQAQDKLFSKFPDAQVARVTSYVADDNDQQESDAYSIQLPDGSNTVLSSAQFMKNRDALFQQFPQARVAKVSDMSDRYWRPKLEEAQQALADFDGEHGQAMSDYEAIETVARRSETDEVPNFNSPAHKWLAEHDAEYQPLKKQRDALREAVYSNPITTRGRKQAQEQAMSAREQYLELASQATTGAERRDYKRAAKLQGDAAELFGAPGQYDSHEGQNGFEKYMSDYGKGMGNTFSDRDFWTRGLTQIARDIDLRGIRKKVQDAEKAKGAPLDEGDYERIMTDSEKAELFSFYNLARAQAERANDLSSAYKAGTSAAESLGYMAEFIISQGLANVAGKALSASTNGFVKWMGQSLMSEKALSRAVNQGVTAIPEMSRIAKVANDVVARPLMQGLWHTTTQLSTLSSMAQMMNETNDEGELNSVGRGIWLGFADSLVENWSESFGNAIDMGFEAAGKGLGWVGEKTLGKTSFGQMARWAAHSPFALTLKEAGFNGFFGEMLEEWAGNAVRLSTGLMSKDEFKQFASIQQQLEMAAAFAPMSIFGLGGNVVSGVRYKKEFDKLSEKTKDILLKNEVPQAEIDELFDKKWATGEDIAAGLAPYAQKVLNSGSPTAKEDYKSILELAELAGATSFNDAMTELRNEERRTEMRDVIQTQLDGNRFWQEQEVLDEDGNTVRTEETVRVVTDEAGNSYYVLSADDAGVFAVSANDGVTKVLNYDQLASDNGFTMNEFLQSRVDAVDKDAEEKRMHDELQQKLADVRQRIASDPHVNIGTPEAPVEATVVPELTDDRLVTVAWKQDGQEWQRSYSWKEMGGLLGMPIEAKTDAELNEEAAVEMQKAVERKDKYNKITPGTPITVTMDTGGEAPESVPYRFAKAIYDENEGFVRIYVTDENGQLLTDKEGNEVYFPEDMVQGLDELAERSATPDAQEEEAAPEPIEEAPVSPVSKYTNEQGKVNQTAFIKNEPEEWAKWNDVRRQDNGDNTMQRLTAAIGELDSAITKSQKELEKEANPDEADRKEEALTGLQERRARLNAILQGYVEERRAIREAEAAAKHAEFQAEIEKKKEAERQKAAKIQDDLKEDASFVQLAENYASQKKTYGATETYNVGGRKFKGRWVVAEATTPKPSHNPLAEFAPTPGYPIGKAGNSNHYDKDKRAQEITREMANEFDERAVQEPVVVTKHGIVLSGNGRTQARLLAAAQETDKAYEDYIREYAYKWGLTAEQVDEYKNPILYFELDEDVEYTAALFDAFNRSTSKQQNVTETAAKVAQMTNDELVMRLDRLFREIGDNIDNLYKNAEKVNDLLNMLQAAGIFNANERARYVDEYGNLSGAGEDLVESVLFGTIFSTSDDSVRAAMNDKSIRRAVSFAFPTLVRLRNLSGELSLIGEMTEAVSLLATAKANNGGKAENAVIDYMLQGDLFSGETPVAKATVQLLAHVLNDGKYGSLRAVLNQYIDRAEAANYGQAIFTDEGTIEVETKEQILRDVLAHNKINVEVYGNTEATQSGVPANDEVRPADSEQAGSGAGTERAGEVNPAGVQADGNTAARVEAEPLDPLEVAFREANRAQAKRRIDKWKKLLGDIFVVHDDISTVKDEAALSEIQKQDAAVAAGEPRDYHAVRGWFDPKTEKAHVYLPHLIDMHNQEQNIDQTILHEVISHKGLRALMGDKFNSFLDKVWEDLMGEDARTYFLNYVEGTEDSEEKRRAAADEFLAHAAENNKDITKLLDENFWTRLAEAVKKFINDALGEDFFKEDTTWFGQLLQDAMRAVKEGTPVQQEDTGSLFSKIDQQGNLLNEDGTLIADAVSSIDELTDEDFTKPSRSVVLPQIPSNVDAAIGAGGKPVVIKKNIFERNAERHKDLTPEQSRDILSNALYNTQLYGQNQPVSRPYNWVVINISGADGLNKTVLLEIDENKDNIEVVHWHYVDKRGLEKIKRQARREGGRILILPSAETEEAGALSGRTSGVSSESKDNEFSAIPQETSEISNDAPEGNTLFSIKGKFGGKTLVGIHNISGRKLAAAIKTGGLANPSMAVIDLGFQVHEDYGDISLIAPASMIDSETGRNAGTYNGDAWTPTYPGVSKQMSDKGWDKFYDAVRTLPEPFSHQVRNDWREYLEDDRMGRSLYWWFLQDTGKKPETIYNTTNLTEEDKAFIRSLSGKRIFGTDEDAAKAIDMYRRLADPSDVAHAEHKVTIKEGRSDRYVDYMKARNEDIDAWGIWTAPVVDFIENLQRQVRYEGTVAEQATYQAAENLVRENNLEGDFQKWLQDKETQYGVKSVLFAGWTPDGDRKYVPNTVENASRLMNKEPEQNAYGNGGLSATRSLLLRRMESLADIRKHRGELADIRGYSSETPEYEQAKDNWFNVIESLAGMQKISDNQFSNIDYAEARLQEAILERDPIAYLNREYRYSIPKNGVFEKALKASLKEIKALPSKYFETKFNRPVYLNEFAAAVVPTDTREDVRQALEKAGVPVYEYDEKEEGSRQKAVVKASEADGIRFSVSRFSPNMQAEMEHIKEAAEAAGTFMKAPNGKQTNLSEENWLLVRTYNFKKYFGDWEKEPEKASKILDENGEPAVVYHGSSWNPLEEPEGEAVFSDSYRGTGSGDNGFFGRGFYFTYGNGTLSRAEAGYYGRNIIEAFLNIRNPFMFNETLYTYKGKASYGGNESESVVILNMVKHFPELVKDYRLTTYDGEGFESGEITLEEYAKLFEETYKTKEFIVHEGVDERDSNIIEVCADPVHHEETINGNVIEWDDYRFRMQMYRPGKNEDAQLAYTHYYLTHLDDFWREDSRDMGVSVPSYMFSQLFESDEFTQALKEKGYDGVLQSALGDEAVAFKASQIKSATANTGEFSEGRNDIRFSVTDSPAFQKWFAGSKVVDEDGNPLVVYRGAAFDPLAQEPGMGVIKPQRYFSPSKEYADIYAYADKGVTRAYYLNIKNPFDIRKPEDRALWQSMMPEGHKIPDTFTGALDWAEFATSIDIDEFIEQHPEYDGVVLDEGGDYKNGEVVERGISFMPFFGGTQVKSAEQNNGEYSPVNPDVRFSVRRYHDFAQAQQMQKQPGGQYVDTGDILFSLSKNNRKTIATWLNKREDLSLSQRGALIDYLDGLDNPTLQLATAKWFSQGAIRLPEDMNKVEQAVSVSRKAKVDPLQYSSPMELLEAHAEFKPTEKKMNPDKVPTLHKVKEMEQGIVIYDVDDTEESRQNMRKIINSHFGKEASPWCLLQGDGNGNLTRASEQYWRNYSAYPKQVAFKDGKLVAFSANDREKRLWWDRQDRPHEGIPVAMKMPNDELGRSAVYELNATTGELGEPSEIHRGNKQNGFYETWSDDGKQQLSRIQYKDGKRHGITETWHRSTGARWNQEEYREGRLVGDRFSWYDDGTPWIVAHYDPEGRKQGEYLEYHDNGQLAVRESYKDGMRDGVMERWSPKGVLVSRTEMKDNYRHGLEETWYDDGERKSSTHYNRARKDGLFEEWYWNGVKRSEIQYKDDMRVGVSYTWYESGNPKSRAEMDDEGFAHGVVVLYYDAPGKVYTREHWNHGDRHGLSEKWFDNGVLQARMTYRDGKPFGITERWDSGGKLWSRTRTFENGTEQSLGNAGPSWYETGQATMFSKVTDKAELDWLNKQPTITLYRAMELIDGELYPPMSQKIPNAKGEKGKKLERRKGSALGQWEKSDEDPAKAYQKKPGGPWYYDLKKIDKDQSDTNGVLYNPYFHLSASPLNDQFSAASSRPNLVVVACEVPISELAGGYKAEKANDSVGAKDWHSGTVTAQLGEGRQVVLSRWAKPVRIVPDSEVAALIAPKIVEKGIIVPPNVVTPSLRNALESRGVKFASNDVVKGLENYSTEEIKDLAKDYINMQLGEMTSEEFDLVDMKVVGSRVKGTARKNSDLDIVLQYSGSMREDDVFNALHDEENPLQIEGISVDINPIRTEETGSIEDWKARQERWEREDETRFSRVDGLPQQGMLFTTDGEAVKYESEGGLPKQEGRTCLVERTYQKSKVFSFMGKNKIESAGDVAFIFKELENAAVENSFIVYVKGGVPTILHTGIGSMTSVTVDELAFAAGISDFAPDEVYMVHNHPSGNVTASMSDLRRIGELQKIAGDIPVTGVIIDTLSGEYATFDSDTGPIIQSRNKSNEGFIPLDVKTFDKAVFSPEYKASLREQRIAGPETVASYLSAHRLGDGQKVGALLVNNDRRVAGNLVLNDNAVSRKNAEQIAREVINACAHCSANNVIFFGDFAYDLNSLKALRANIEVLSGKSVSVLDVVRVEGNHTLSANNDTLHESVRPEELRFSKANQTQNGFISNAELAVEGIPMERATTQQWLKMLEGKGGLKAGEDKWLGLSDWLKEQNGSVTKQQILDYINEHRIQIEEVHYIDQDNSAALKALQEEFDTIPFDDPQFMWDEADKRLAEFYAEMEEKYGEDYQYMMTGSENAVENHLLEEREKWDAENAPDATEAAYNAMVDKYGDDFSLAFTVDDRGLLEIVNEDAASYFLGERPINQTRLHYTTEGLSDKREIALTVPTVEPYNEHDQIHFGDADEGRAVAWIRFGDTKVKTPLTIEAQDADNARTAFLQRMHYKYQKTGKALLDSLTPEEMEEFKPLLRASSAGKKQAEKKVLVIDEIQSKRHQEAREKGYRDDELHKKAKRRSELSALYYSDAGMSYEEHKEFQALQRELSEVGEKEVADNKNRVPAAPFEKNWHELAMKRMLRLAAEEGYDYVAWTTGEQQADRYDIGNVVSRISVYPNKANDGADRIVNIHLMGQDGDFINLVVNKDGLVEHGPSDYQGERLSDIVGKHLADSILTAAEATEIKGDGLRVGAEGMKGFYDEILPRFMNKYGKKWGVKVEDIELPELEASAHIMHAVPVTDAMKESVKQGQLMFSKSAEAAERAHVGGIGAVIGPENVTGFYMDLYKAMPKEMRAEVTEQAMGRGLNFRETLRDYISDLAGTGNDETGMLRLAETLLDDYVGDLDEKDARYILWRGERKADSGDLLDVAHDRFMRNHLGIGMPENGRVSSNTDIAQAREETDTNPTDAQKKAGNYKHGHVTIDGYDISLENPKGSIRSGKDAKGKEWSVTMNNDYGYIRMTEGVDGDHIDIFLSDNPTEGKVFVVDQVNPDNGEFDEHKVMYGFNSAEEAREAYLSNYSKGWKGLGAITEVSKDEFRKWVDSSHRKTKPFADYKSVDGIRFSLKDEFGRAELTADVTVDNGKRELDSQKKAVKQDTLQALRHLMQAQREYDRRTVDALTNLAKDLMKDQFIDALSRREVARLLGIIRTSVGKAPKTVKKNADILIEMVIDNLLKSEREGLKKLTSTTGTKTNTTGVEVQGELDIRGQKILKAYKEGITHDVGAEGDDETMNTLYGLRARLADRIASRDDAVRKEAEAEDAGLSLAIEYKEGVKALLDEEKELEDTLKDLNAALKDGNISKSDHAQNVMATEDAIRENRIDQIEAFRSFRRKMQEMMAGSAEAKKSFMEREKERIEAIHHLANSDMQGRSADTDHKPTFKDKLANSPIVRFFAAPLATFDQMLRLFGHKNVAGEGYLWNKYMRDWQEATARAYIGQRDAKAKLDEKVSEVFGRSDMKWSDLFDEERRIDREKGRATIKWRSADGEMMEHELSQGQLLYILMVDKMADGRMKLRKMGIMEEDVAAIRRQMDERFIELADWLQNEYLVELRNKYNAVHERLFGASMAAIDNYFPLVINKRDLTKNEDIASADYESLPSTTTGSIIKRRRNNKALDLLNADAFSVVLNHIDQMEQWAAFAEFNKDINALLSYKRFRNQVQNMASVYGSGKTLWQNFKDVCRIAGNAYHPSVKVDSLDSAAVNLAKGVTSAKISFRVYTAIKQFLSMPAFVADANVVELAKDMVNPVGAWNWAMENLPLFEKRWKSRIAGDTRLMTTDMDWKIFRSKVYQKLSKLGMTPNAFVDAWTVAVGAHAMYKTRYDRYIKEGYAEEQADKRAKQDATTLYNETQQSNENAFLSTAQLDRTVFSTAITVFRNSSMGYQRQAHDAIRNLGKLLQKGYKEESIAFMTKQLMRDGLTEEQAATAAERRYNRAFARNAVRVSTFAFLVQFAWNLGGSLAYLLFGDDDDEKEEMLMEAFRHALLGGTIEGLAGGNVMSDALNMVAKGESLRNYDPSLLPILADMKRVYNMMGYDKVAGANELLNLAVQAGIGVNPQTLSDAVVAVIDACNGDMEMSREAMLLFMRVMQVPRSQVDKIYIDELGMDVGSAQQLSVNQLAERYANYRLNKDAGALRPLYSDELEAKRAKSHRNRIKKMVKERKERKKQQ